jgi:hypothetical protein
MQRTRDQAETVERAGGGPRYPDPVRVLLLRLCCESLLSRVTSDLMNRAGASACLALPSRDSPDEPFPGYAAGILVDRPCQPDSGRERGPGRPIGID